MSNDESNFPTHLSTEQTEKLIANQEKQLAIQEQDIQLRKQTDENAYKFANSNLQANLQDRREQRQTYLSFVNKAFIFAAVIFLSIVVLIIAAMICSQAQIALEIIKTIGLLGTGGFGGYFFGKSKAKDNKAEGN